MINLANYPLCKRYIRYIRSAEKKEYANAYLFWRVELKSIVGSHPVTIPGQPRSYYHSRMEIRNRIDGLLGLPKEAQW